MDGGNEEGREGESKKRYEYDQNILYVKTRSILLTLIKAKHKCNIYPVREERT